MADICVPSSRLIEVAVIPSSMPRFFSFDGISQTCFSVLLHHCNTRYEWLVRPCSAETCTLQETPSFAWRTNGLRYLRWGGRGLCLGAEKTRSQKNAWREACRTRSAPASSALLSWCSCRTLRTDLLIWSYHHLTLQYSHLLFSTLHSWECLFVLYEDCHILLLN